MTASATLGRNLHGRVQACGEIDRVLAAAMRGDAAPWPDHLREVTEVALAVRRLAFHGIGALLVHGGWSQRDWPSAIAEAARVDARTQALWEATHRPVVGEMIASLAEAGVRSLVLKGTALAYSVWAQPELRRRSDTDLFIAPGDVERARRLLAARGWQVAEREIFQETWVLSDGAFDHAVDLHWRMRDLLEEPTALRFDACYARSVSLARFHPLAGACDPATTLINCALNHAAHRVYGYRSLAGANTDELHLGGVADADRLAVSFSPHDWSRLVALAGETRTAGAVLESLDLAANWLGTRCPAEPMAELRLLAAAQAFAPAAWTAPTAQGSLSSFIRKVRAAHGWRAKRAMTIRHVWPPAHAVGLEPAAGTIRLTRARLARLVRIARAAGGKPVRW